MTDAAKRRMDKSKQGSTHKSKKRGGPPHIVYFLLDDVGFGDLGEGSDLEWASPTFNEFSEDGIYLNNYYALHLCTPARASLLTGLYPIHTGMQHSLLVGAAPWGLPTKYTLLPEIMSDEANGGYRSHMVGKWHLGYFHEAYTPLERGSGHQSSYHHASLPHASTLAFTISQAFAHANAHMHKYHVCPLAQV